jgi:hypothetical protein
MRFADAARNWAMAVDFTPHKPTLALPLRVRSSAPTPMQKNNEQLVQARGLRADILAAPTVWLPRRDIIVEWLNTFLLRAATPGAALEESDVSDLVALDRFLRKQHVPVA